MNLDINIKQFIFSQPNAPEEKRTDKIYMSLSNKLLTAWEKSKIMSHIDDNLKKVIVIGLMGYYQDIITDAGLWRTFVNECKRMYGNYVPFHKDQEDYIEYELNRADIEFLTWYFLAFNSMQYRFLYPLHADVLRLADLFYGILEDEYDDIETPEDYRHNFDVDLYDTEDSHKIHDLSEWLFWKSWLLVPPFQLTYAQIYSSIVEIQHNSPTPEVAKQRIDEIKHEAVATLPTGPLALYLREWLNLLIEKKYPRQRKKSSNDNIEPHPYYVAFTKATGGKEIAYIKTYDELNHFFINSLGWSTGEEHLPQMKNYSDFVLMVTYDKGLMVAKNIAQCVADPANHLYDKEYARNFAFNLISQRGVCPGDMLRHFLSNGFLPDTTFPETVEIVAYTPTPSENDRRSVAVKNSDFLARVYLQEYYRGDD